MKLNNIVVDNLYSKIKDKKILPYLPFIKEDLIQKGFSPPKHPPFFFIDDVEVNDEYRGFLLVNMDGFYSNCVDSKKITFIFDWDSLTELKIKAKTPTMLGLFRKEGPLLFTQKNTSNSLKIIYAIYQYVWRDVIEKNKGQSIIHWEKDMGFTEKSFSSWTELINYSDGNTNNFDSISKKDLVEKVFNSLESSSNDPDSHRFVKTISSNNPDINDVLQQIQ